MDTIGFNTLDIALPPSSPWHDLPMGSFVAGDFLLELLLHDVL